MDRQTSGIDSGRDMRVHVRLALLMLCAVGSLAILAGMEAFSVTEQTRAYQADLERRINQRAQIRRAFLMVQQAETAQLGYHLLGEDESLRRLNEVNDALPSALDRLVELFRNDPKRELQARGLRTVAARRMQQLLEGFKATGGVNRNSREAVGLDIDQSRARDRIQTRAQMQRLVDDMIALEDDDIRRASQALAGRIRISRTLMIFLVGGIVLLVTFVVLLALAYLSRQTRVEQGLREATRLAREASEAKTQFLASMSHEIRTPLTAILGYTDLLLDERQLSARQRGYVAGLKSAATTLSTLVDDVLDLSKISAGKIVLSEEPFSLNALITNSLAIASVTARKKGLDLRREIDPGLPNTVLGDETRLRQVVLNLLNNAVKFTSEGSVTLRVAHEGSCEAGECIRFEVADTGIGIAAERQDRVFRRFSQVSPSIQHEYGGTGLGLAICKRLVGLMGGEIGLESEEGSGSTFWVSVSLPEAEVADRSLPQASETESGTGGHILLAEDAPQNQDLVSTILRNEGYHVDIANDGAAALAMIRETPYDLVLIDMQMPRMNGIEATRRIRKSEGPESALPIIAMTANVLPEQMESFRRAGGDDCLAKPFRKSNLINKVAHWLAAQNGQSRGTGRYAGTSDVHDRDTFEELRSVMGSDWTRMNLIRLKERIDQAFFGPASEIPESEGLWYHVHRIVSEAGQLGFANLSWRASELEQAIRADGVDEAAFARARRAADQASGRIDRLLGEIDLSAEVHSG